jgi:hypothetical protein
VGLFDKAVRLAAKNSGKLKQLAEDNADKITDTVGKVNERIDKQTQGKYRDKLDKVEGAVGKALQKDDPGEGGPAGRGPYHPEDPPGPTPPGR